MNTRHQLKALFPEPHQLVVYGHNSQPTYFGRSTLAWQAVSVLNRLTPPALASTLMVFMRKAG